jgi:hypothetical protein
MVIAVWILALMSWNSAELPDIPVIYDDPANPDDRSLPSRPSQIPPTGYEGVIAKFSDQLSSRPTKYSGPDNNCQLFARILGFALQGYDMSEYIKNGEVHW